MQVKFNNLFNTFLAEAFSFSDKNITLGDKGLFDVADRAIVVHEKVRITWDAFHVDNSFVHNRKKYLTAFKITSLLFVCALIVSKVFIVFLT